MKASITLEDGTRVDLNGTQENVARAIQALLDTYSVSLLAPYYVPTMHSVCAHEYESPWMGINPPPCKKCGETMTLLPSITYSPF